MFVALASAFAGAARVVAQAPRKPSKVDSVDVLLLGIPRISALTLRGRGIRIDGVDAVEARVDVAIAGSRVDGARNGAGADGAVDGAGVNDAAKGAGLDGAMDAAGILVDGHRRTSARITATADISLVNGKRRRLVRGVVTLGSRNGALVVVARIASSDYLAGTLSSEANLSDPGAYLVALAVLQKNYLRTHRGRHAPFADVCDNTHCQLFNVESIGARAHSVVREAEAIELQAGSAHPCYYSANCGGSSLTPADVWGRSEPGYSAVRCDDCRGDSWHRWSTTVKATPRARAALAGARTAPFVDDDFKIRVGRALGFNTVPSNTIDRLERRGAQYLIEGRGFGHRVGLCQAGARQAALRGRDALEILSHYFPSATLRASDSGTPSHRPQLSR